MNRWVPGITWCVAVLLLISALVNCVLIFQQIMIHARLKEVSNYASKTAQFDLAVQNLGSDLIEYAKTHPDMYSILRRYGVNPPTAPPPEEKPKKATPSKTNKK